jgi:hypothetical protein
VDLKTDCLVCHNGNTFALPKNSTHLKTTQNCSQCHLLTAWKPANYFHIMEDKTCNSCHNNKQAKGLTGNHINTNNQCDACHLSPIGLTLENQNILKFKPDLKKTHQVELVDNLTSCSSCHNGISFATPKNDKHYRTQESCSVCHRLDSWKPSTFKHSITDSKCTTCHNGITASSKPINHTLSTTAECIVCHSQKTWIPAQYQNFSHKNDGPLPSQEYKGQISNHISISNCTTCHSKISDQVVYKNQKYAPGCLGCHLSDFGYGFHRGNINNDVQKCLKCHIYKSWNVN